MNDERIFEMLDECVAYAVDALENVRMLYPFAMVLDVYDNIGSLGNDERDHEKCYTTLVADLESEVKTGRLRACAVVARVTIPEQFSPAVSDGLRIHVEDRNKMYEKIGARLLYIPYQLFKNPQEGGKLTVKLHDPIPVAIPHELFIAPVS